MRIQVIPFRARHVALIRPDVPEDFMALAIDAETAGRGYTACLLGDPIGCAGVRMQRAGMGEAWALFSPLLKRQPLSLFRAVSKGLSEIIAETEFKTIYAVVDPSDQAAARFMRHLGFEMKRHLYERVL